MNSRFIYGICSIVLAAIIAFIAIPAVSARTNGKTEIVRVTQTVQRGAVFSSDMVEVIEVGEYNLPGNVARTLEDVVGMYCVTDLAPGDYILGSKVSSTPISSDIELNNLPSGKVAISVTVKSLASGLSDKLQAGDIIRFYHFLDFSLDIPELQFVKVLSVTDAKGYNVDNAEVPDPNAEEEKAQSATITVLASPGQAQILTRMENEGNLHVALVSRGSPELSAELLEQQEEYFRKLEEEAKALAEAEAALGDMSASQSSNGGEAPEDTSSAEESTPDSSESQSG